jgi:hypothetical protein
MNPIVVVSGLPRSGTSMMMKMLEAAGIEPLTDQVRLADEDNPQGYYEFEPVKDLERDHAWMADAGGRSVKVVSRLLVHLPRDHRYRVIFMRRQMGEILASQRAMLERRRAQESQPPDETMKLVFEKHLDEVEQWLLVQENLEVLFVSYNAVLENPEREVAKVGAFLHLESGLEAIVAAVDHTLYRRRSLC